MYENNTVAEWHTHTHAPTHTLQLFVREDLAVNHVRGKIPVIQREDTKHVKKLSQFADIFHGPVQATNNASDYKERDRTLKALWGQNPYRLEFGEMDQRFPVQRDQKKNFPRWIKKTLSTDTKRNPQLNSTNCLTIKDVHVVSEMITD